MNSRDQLWVWRSDRVALSKAPLSLWKAQFATKARQKWDMLTEHELWAMCTTDVWVVWSQRFCLDEALIFQKSPFSSHILWNDIKAKPCHRRVKWKNTTPSSTLSFSSLKCAVSCMSDLGTAMIVRRYLCLTEFGWRSPMQCHISHSSLCAWISARSSRPIGIEERLWAYVGRLHVPIGPRACRWALGLATCFFLTGTWKWKDGGICGSVSISFRDSKSSYMTIDHDARLSGLKTNLAPKMRQGQIASANQSSEYLESLPYRETTLAGNITCRATTLNESEITSTSVSSNQILR